MSGLLEIIPRPWAVAKEPTCTDGQASKTCCPTLRRDIVVDYPRLLTESLWMPSKIPSGSPFAR
jgi:hypothetical protein